MNTKSFFLSVVLSCLLISVVSAQANVTKTYIIEPPGTTPFNLWGGAILLAVVLCIVSFIRFPKGEEGLVSILSWIPAGYAMFTSFAVDRITSTGYSVDASGVPVLLETHTVSSYPTIALLLMFFLAFLIGNTYRIYMYQVEERMNPRARGTPE